MDHIIGVYHLMAKDFKLEWRRKFALSGLAVYVLSTVFVVYVSVVKFEPQTWNVLFWIIFVFVAINAILKSFTEEANRQYLYYYTLVNPIQLLLAKWLYNTLLLLALSVVLAVTLILVGGNYIVSMPVFLCSLVVGSVAMSGCLTVISSIAIKADHSAMLMAILAFPVIIPILLSLIKMSSRALGLLPDKDISSELLTLSSLILLLLGLGILLFPYLWKS